ncbi:MAG TPA: hypothetical protein VG408_08970, partial [Actinomycetota bacterium]|nr:hypothetical protein [Actinomycetota bacterium]
SHPASASGASSTSPSPRATPTASPAPDPDEAFYPTKVTLTYRSRDSRFQGTVASPSARCERGREVVLKKKRPGKDRIVALDITDRTGRWKVGGFVDPEGAYYAVAKTKGFVTNDGDLQSCARDRSRTLHR